MPTRPATSDAPVLPAAPRSTSGPWRCGLYLALAMLALGAATAAQPRTPGAIRATLAKVEVTIRDRAATVELTQTLRNDGRRDAEARWFLPLPADASVDRFQMIQGGKTLDGEVLTAGTAREVYEKIVRQRRDPGLLEYVDQGLLRARVFPVPPGGELEVRVRYRQVLRPTGGLHRFRFPLRALGIGGRAPERTGFQLELASQTPLKTIYSPLDGLDVVRDGDHRAEASLELQGRPAERDLDLFFGVDERALGVDLLAHRDGDAGHFLMMLTPQSDWPEREGTKRVIQFALDVSGSMRGEKIEQARRALRSFVDSMRPQDHFDILTFSTTADSLFGGPVPADEEHLTKARQWIDQITARGGTNIEAALDQGFAKAVPPALEDDDAVLPILVFLTDGLPTVGTTSIDQLLENAAARNTRKARLFTFGVGYDVNTRLLGDLALTTRGDTSYVEPHEDIEIETSALFDKISHPVLTDLSIEFDGVQVSALEPQQLPDLFKGSSLNLLGSYRGSGAHAIRVKGKVQGIEKELIYQATFPARATEHDFVPVLWAKRRVAFLLEACWQNDHPAELVEEIERLSREYGLVTPFTSALILEDEQQLADQLGLESRSVLRDAYRPVELTESDEFFVGAGKFGPQSGRGAVTKAEQLRRLKQAKRNSGEKRYRGPGGVVPPNPGGGGPRSPGATGPRSPGATGPRGPSSPGPAGPSSPGPGGPATSGRLPPEPDTGSEKVEPSGPRTERIGSRTFVLVGGVWVDRSYDKDARLPRRTILLFSKEYFELIREKPELTRLFALGKHVIAVIEGTVYELVEDKPTPKDPDPKKTKDDR